MTQVLDQADEAKFNQLKSLSHSFYSRQDFAHNSDHVSHVLQYAEIIAQREHANLFLVRAGAWLHQFHDDLEILESLLNEATLPQSDRESLFHIVKSCRPHRIAESDSLEAKVVYDADALAVISTYGLVRELICNAVVRKMPWQRSVSETKRVQELFGDTLQTKTARSLADGTRELCNLFWEDYQHWDKVDEKYLANQKSPNSST